jgi:hypothetical protein
MKGFLVVLVVVLALSPFGCRTYEPAPYYGYSYQQPNSYQQPYYCQPCTQPCVQRAVVTPSPCAPVATMPAAGPCTTVSPPYTTTVPTYTPAPLTPTPSSPAAMPPALPAR